MASQKVALAIIDRSFDYRSPIGEGLLGLAELATSEGPVCVMTQSTANINQQLAAEGRGQGVVVHACKAYTTSSSGLIKRIIEAVYFMLWIFYRLVRTRPEHIYVATNPPVVVPFVVALYCSLTGASYVYHLQDIHPEATNIIVPMNHWLLKLLKAVDNFSLRHASALITLSEDMEATIMQRIGYHKSIFLVDNPAFDVKSVNIKQRRKGIVFCGNLGRLQRIPLLIDAIQDYLKQGGELHFTFAGGGIYTSEVEELASTYNKVEYLGQLSPICAAQLLNRYQWAFLPIDDEVTRYAFPSKSSGYALANIGVLAVCGRNTSVGRWVNQYKIGRVCEPDRLALIGCLFEIEGSDRIESKVDDALGERLQVSYFSKALMNIIFE